MGKIGRRSPEPGYGPSVAEPPPAPPPRPPALRASIVFGVIGAMLLAVGFVTANTPVLVLSGAAGSLSLASALVWRSQLVQAWRAEHKPPRGQPNGAS